MGNDWMLSRVDKYYNDRMLEDIILKKNFVDMVKDERKDEKLKKKSMRKYTQKKFAKLCEDLYDENMNDFDNSMEYPLVQKRPNPTYNCMEAPIISIPIPDVKPGETITITMTIEKVPEDDIIYSNKK